MAMESFRSSDDFEISQGGASRWVMRISLAFTTMLGLALMGAAVLYVWLYIHRVQNGYKLAKLSEEYEHLTTIQRKLRLEWSQVENPVRLEELGRDQFGLAPPGPAQLLILH